MICIFVFEFTDSFQSECTSAVSKGTASGEGHHTSDLFHDCRAGWVSFSIYDFFHSGVKLQESLTTKGTFAAALLSACQQLLHCCIQKAAALWIYTDHSVTKCQLCCEHKVFHFFRQIQDFSHLYGFYAFQISHKFFDRSPEWYTGRSFRFFCCLTVCISNDTHQCLCLILSFYCISNCCQCLHMAGDAVSQ